MMLTADDIRQSGVVAMNEIRKFMSARKFRLYIGLVVLIVALITVLPYIVGDGLSGSSGSVFSSYIGYASFLVMLGATLFASYTIVSEFEERTALILFTRPIRRSSIFIGKLVACYVLVAAVMMVYYAAALLVSLAVGGTLVTSFLPSIAMCLLFVFAASGVAMLVSSLFKKGGTAAVITFIVILLLLPVISAVLSTAGIDTWFMLDSAMGSITTSIPEYVEQSNQALTDLGEALGITISPDMLVQAADCLRSGAVMLAWGLVTLVLSFLAFARREF